MDTPEKNDVSQESSDFQSNLSQSTWSSLSDFSSLNLSNSGSASNELPDLTITESSSDVASSHGVREASGSPQEIHPQPETQTPGSAEFPPPDYRNGSRLAVDTPTPPVPTPTPPDGSRLPVDTPTPPVPTPTPPGNDSAPIDTPQPQPGAEPHQNLNGSSDATSPQQQSLSSILQNLHGPTDSSAPQPGDTNGKNPDGKNIERQHPPAELSPDAFQTAADGTAVVHDGDGNFSIKTPDGKHFHLKNGSTMVEVGADGKETPVPVLEDKKDGSPRTYANGMKVSTDSYVVPTTDGAGVTHTNHRLTLPGGGKMVFNQVHGRPRS